MTISFPIERVREQFPALQRKYKGKPAIYFDGPGGSQVYEGVIDAITSYMANGGANLHGQFPTSEETEHYIEEARNTVADLVQANKDEVAFGPNATSLAFSIARALSKSWNSDDEIVLTEIDHRANVDPWLTAAKDKGTTVRWLEVDTETLTLDLDDLNHTITDKTKLVAVTLASNAVGTITNIEPISKRAKEVGAILVIDAVHAVPHFAVDRDKLGADILLFSAYKFFGPHVGMAVIKKDLFESLEVYKLDPAPAFTPDKLETGTQNHEGIAAIKAAVSFVEGLGYGETRRERVLSGFAKIETYENDLANLVREQLSKISGITLYQAPASVNKTPTIAFRIDGINPSVFCKWMAEEYSIFIADGDFYATTLANKLGINHKGGWIRAGFAPYNTIEEVELFIEGTKKFLVSKV